MGMLVEVVWRDIPRDTKSTGGAFVRPESVFRDSLAEPESGRYHLYVSKACPWAHRTLVVRALKGLESAIPVFYADPYMAENGWEYRAGGIRYLYELYARARPGYSGRGRGPGPWYCSTQPTVRNTSP